MHARPVWLCSGLLLIALTARAETISGRWVASDEEGVTLTLQEAADGTVRGTLSGDEAPLRLEGRRSGQELSGTVDLPGGQPVPFRAKLRGDRMEFGVTGAEATEWLQLRREPPANANARASAPASPSGRRVVINAKPLSADDLARIERTYQLRIPDAKYWYDPVSGAWGGEGGPTAGFIPPGLALGGPLRADASGGGSGVFINGREAHRFDVLALAQLLGSPILPARYFLSAQGLAGFEGGPPLWNLLAIASANAGGGGGGGGSTSWSSRLSSGISDGETSAVFLPNGGIVSSGN